jgi:stalled ribosome alternative rescue factor ArfA
MKKEGPKKGNWLAKLVRTPLFRKRREKDKTKYDRKKPIKE